MEAVPKLYPIFWPEFITILRPIRFDDRFGGPKTLFFSFQNPSVRDGLTLNVCVFFFGFVFQVLHVLYFLLYCVALCFLLHVSCAFFCPVVGGMM